MKKAVSFLILFIFVFALSGKVTSLAASSSMQIAFIDCGQGDAILISSNNKHMLVDAGKESCVDSVTKYLDANNIETLDYVVSSHPDEDHIGGMPAVYNKYQVNNSIYSSYQASSNIFSRYISAVENEPQSSYKTADNSDEWYVGDARVDVIYDGKDASNANDSSVVLNVLCGKTELLLTGDISSTVEQQLLSSGEDIDVDILKVAHHGSASSSCQAFLAEATPKISVISVGEGNSYGHPTSEALSRISQLCPTIYRTDLKGNIILNVQNDVIKYNNYEIEAPDVNICSVKYVYVTESGKKYHASSTCSNMKSPIKTTLSQAQKTRTACSKCIGADFEGIVAYCVASDWTVTQKATIYKTGLKVRKCIHCGKTLESSTIARTTFSSYPKSLTATLYGYDDVKLSWSKTSDAKLYKVYYKKASAKSYTYFGKTSSTSCKITNLSDGIKYNFKVIACAYIDGKYIDSTKSKTISLSTTKNLSAPSKVSASLYGYDDVKLSWSKVKNADAYRVYYKKSGTKTYKLKATVKSASYSFANLSDGVKYIFKIVPCTKVNDSYFEDDSYEATSATTLKKVSTPKATKYSSGKVKISWSNIAGESGYQISKSTSKSKTGTITTYKTTDGKSKVLSATKGKTYYYKVRAFKTVNDKRIYGPWSTVKAYKLK